VVPTYDDREQEALDTYRRYVSVRERIDGGELEWNALAEFFTDDAYFIDPAWGRVDGIEAITEFLQDSMVGFDDWTFPEQWTTVDGARVITMFWNRIPGSYDDGQPFQAPGVSILTYSGDGKFSSEVDLINMDHMNEVIRDSGWKPSGGINFPPREPRRY